MEKEIKYVGFYDILRNEKRYRVYSLAAAKKMDYVCSEINSLGYKVKIISPSHVIAKGKKKVERQSEQISETCFLELPPSREAENKMQRIFRVLQARIWLFMYLMKNTERNEKILVYHNYDLAIPVIMAKKIKGFDIVLEVEEIYAKVWKLSWIQRWKEKLLLKYANNNSLVVSEVLAEELGIKDPAIAYGAYMICDEPQIKENNGIIKLVLTGMVDKERGNGFLAVDTMRYLPSNYKLFLSGTVATKDKDEFFELIKEVNEELGREACSYLGLLNDKDYKKLLLSSDIALNPQKEGEFEKYIFPSKILTYIGHGLPVVSTRGESIVKSRLANMITFADDYNGVSIATAIKNVNIRSQKEYLEYLHILQEAFKERLDRILKS